MSRPVRVILAAILLVPVIGTVLVLRGDRDPSYQGRTLPEWIALHTLAPGDPHPREAIIRITTNSLPEMFRRLSYDPAPRRRMLEDVALFIPSRRLANALLADSRIRQAVVASQAIAISGKHATQALPDLTRMALDTNLPPAVSARAINLLPSVAPDPAPLLTTILLTPTHMARDHVVPRVVRDPEVAHAIVTNLLPTAKATDPTEALLAVEALGVFARVDVDTNLTIPALQQALTDPRQPVSFAAQEALGNYEMEHRHK